MNLQEICWPIESLGHAVAFLSGGQPETLACPTSLDALPEWLTWAALRANSEAVSVDIAVRDLESFLSSTAPAIYEVGGKYLAVFSSGKELRVVTPDLSLQTVSIRTLADALKQPFRNKHQPALEALIAATGLTGLKQQRALSALLKNQDSSAHFRRGWTLRRFQDKSSIWRGIPALITFHTAQYLLWLASWGVLGTLSLSGHMDRGWLTAWALLLLTLIPFRVLTTWSQGVFAIRLGAMLKRRLLQGALRLQPEEVRAQGVGSFLGQALEAEAVENLAVSGGLTGLLAAIEMVPAMFVLGRLAVPLAVWCVLALFAGWRFYTNYKSWTGKRMDLTTDLVESMVGHRTRLVQQSADNRHGSEDSSSAEYLGLSTTLDKTGSWLVAAIPRGWLLLGIASIAPSIVAGKALSAETAILLGGVLLAFSAFQRLVASFADISGAIISWQRIKPLLTAARRVESVGELPPRKQSESRGQSLLEADQLSYRYPGQAVAALQGCTLAIRRGERILLEGPSGGGKTTLTSLLTGIRTPESGLLLINGLDRHTLGESAWRKQIAAAPQFHENHLITETLAFNLLMGRNWPPSSEDLREAADICHELGLGDLLGRMPSGLLQMIGEGGWQLSHGERSRIFLARALLQHSEMVILDESFAALDPENLQIAMQTTLRRAETLLVIAHP